MVLLGLMHSEAPITASSYRARLLEVKEQITRTIKGKDEVVDSVIICLLSGGHLLLEDLPGLGKTTLAYCLARALDCDFNRIQFTSDLLPSDVIGVSVYDETQRSFIFKPGPIFSNVVLADEINRTTPKTQSALLEAMDRGKLTVDGETYSMGRPFMVFATQNPVDYEGTFPLPDSQMDRFMMRLRMGYAGFEEELEILRNGLLRYDEIEVKPVLSTAEIEAMQSAVAQVFIEDSVLRYLLQIVHASRTEVEFRSGISTRGCLALKTASQACALYHGRTFVTPDDILEMVPLVLIHRLSLRHPAGDALEERKRAEGILRKMIDSISLPD